MSWVSNWAEKGNSLLNTLDSRVADLLEINKSGGIIGSLSDPRSHLTTSGETFHSTPQSTLMLSSVEISSPSHNLSSHVSVRKSLIEIDKMSPAIATVDADAELFEFLNDPGAHDISSSTNLKESSKTPIVSTNLTETALQLTTSSSPTTAETNTSHNAIEITEVDAVLENRLLHNEVASLNKEVSNLIQRNRKAEEECQDMQKQIEDLESQLQEACSKIGSSKSSIIPEDICKQNQELASKVDQLTQALTETQTSLEQSEKKAAEARRLAELSGDRADQIHQEANRVTRQLAEYKEKAAHILASKEKVIEELRQTLARGDRGLGEAISTETSEIAALRAEVSHLRKEEASWRLEVDHREVALRELEEQMQVEHASLRRTVAMQEEQLLREKEVRIDIDKEIIDLQTKLKRLEERAAREKSELHSIVQSNETELARMRRLLAEGGVSSFSSSGSPKRTSAPPPRTDAEQILALEARLRQLNDSLITKQDALDAVLAQNHGLKIRLDRLDTENEVHLLSSSKLSVFPNGYSQLPADPPVLSSRGTFGFARLHLIETNLPSWLRTLITTLDGVIIQLVSYLRRRPMFRLLFSFYLLLVHVWFVMAFFVVASPPLAQLPTHPLPAAKS